MAPSFILFAALLQSVIGFVGAGQSPQLKPPASTTSEKDKCMVSGVVTSMQTGEPLKKVTLHLMLRSAPRNTNGVFEQTGYGGTSSPDGTFKFESVEPGEYSLSGERTGYIRTSYGSKNGTRGGTTLNLTPGQQLTDVKMQLVAQAIISGRVVDDDGDPISGLSIQALGRASTRGGKARYYMRGQASTDDTGSYRIANLTPGKYYVAARNIRNQTMGMREKPAEPGKPNLQPVRTFYPSSLDRDGASVIEVKAGQEMPGVEIRMRSMETFHIRGKVSGDLSENEGMRSMLMLMPRDETDGFPGPNWMSPIGKDHTFDMANVPPGSYVILMPGFNGSKQTARQMVDVGSADVNDVVVTAQPTFTIHGSVELQGTLSGSAKDKGLENVYVNLQPDDGAMMFGGTQGMARADGTFTMENVTPGKFRVNVFNEPEGSYLTSVRFGNQEAFGKTLDLTQAGGGDLHVVLRTGAAEVSGTVTKKTEDSGSGSGSAATPVSGASVILIPEDLTRNGGSLHNGGTNQNGSFTVKGLAPGVYYALAYLSDDYQSFDDPETLKQLVDKGTKVEVKENDKQVTLTLVAAEDLPAEGANN